jgi:glutathione S-transferase
MADIQPNQPNQPTQPVILWQMQRMWGLPNPSPFCMKVETWLRMTGIDHVTRVVRGVPKSPSGKIPYIEHPEGGLSCDSSVIIETLTDERGVTLDDFMSDAQRVQSLLIQRLFEEELYFVMLHDRWVDDAGFAITREAYFGKLPWIVRTFLVPILRRQLVAATRGQGFARLSPDTRARKTVADVRAIASLLGDQPFFMGQPSSIDAIAYAFLANGLSAPYPGALQDELRAHPSLVAYCERMRAAYFADDRFAA